MMCYLFENSDQTLISKCGDSSLHTPLPGQISRAGDRLVPLIQPEGGDHAFRRGANERAICRSFSGWRAAARTAGAVAAEIDACCAREAGNAATAVPSPGRGADRRVHGVAGDRLRAEVDADRERIDCALISQMIGRGRTARVAV